jgi:Flp pilus assembly protein TadG
VVLLISRYGFGLDRNSDRVERPVTFLHDRRGVTALMFALIATALLGIVGLGTEVGSWYVAQSQAQNAADAAAMSGAIAAASAVASGSGTDPISAGQAAAATEAEANGYSLANPASVSATVPPQVTATVNVSITPLLASLFRGSSQFTITAVAGGQLEPYGTACVLSLGTGPLNVYQDQFSIVPGACFYASNDVSDTYGVNIYDLNIWAGGITTVTDCSGCPTDIPPLTGGAGAQAGLDQPNSSFQPPTPDPYAAAFSKVTFPDATGISVINPPGTPDANGFIKVSGLVPASGDGGITCASTTGSPPCAYLNQKLTIDNTNPVALSPGTYIFVNSSLKIPNGAIVACSPPVNYGHWVFGKAVQR